MPLPNGTLRGKAGQAALSLAAVSELYVPFSFAAPVTIIHAGGGGYDPYYQMRRDEALCCEGGFFFSPTDRVWQKCFLSSFLCSRSFFLLY